MMVLFDLLHQADGQTHPQWGLLPGQVSMQRRLAALGPHQLTLSAGGEVGIRTADGLVPGPVIPTAPVDPADQQIGRASCRERVSSPV